jgi:hypothetical protein
MLKTAARGHGLVHVFVSPKTLFYKQLTIFCLFTLSSIAFWFKNHVSDQAFLPDTPFYTDLSNYF